MYDAVVEFPETERVLPQCADDACGPGGGINVYLAGAALECTICCAPFGTQSAPVEMFPSDGGLVMKRLHQKTVAGEDRASELGQ
jgi:hypothetical protein